MLVSENILEQALAQVFDGIPAGASMTLAEVSAGWNKVGLRKSDLRDAIREMVEHRCLISYNYLDSLAFELTEHGAMRFDVCRDYKPGLQDWLKEQRAARSEDRAVDALSSTWNRRALQT
jgi:hypothetical protein